MFKLFDKKFVGGIALFIAISLNFAHAINDYGVIKNNLHWRVLGQTITSGGGSTTGGDNSPKNCPPVGVSGCLSGGCGASSCSIKTEDVFGSTQVETTASSGYFACCYKDWMQRHYAQTFKMSDCCPN